jgi:hypothetical protein
MFLDAITSIFAGGATGLFGAALQRFFDFKIMKANHSHEIEMRKVDADIMRQEWAGRVKVAETEGEAKVEVVEGQAFSESMFKEPERYSDTNFSPAQRWLMVLLDFFRGMVRPGLTVYLCVITTLMYLSARAMVPAEVPVQSALALIERIQAEILYVTSTVVFWWFGTRNKKSK